MANKQYKSSLVRFFKEDINDTRILDNGFGATVKRAFKLACGVKDNEDFADTAPRWWQAINPVNWLEFAIRLPADLLDRASLIGIDRNSSIGRLIRDEENEVIPAKDVKLSPGRKVVRAVANLARIPHILTRPFTYPSKYFIADGTKEKFTRADYVKAGAIIVIALVVAGLIAAMILTGGWIIPALAGVATALASFTGISAATSFLVATVALATGAFVTLAKIVPALVEELQGLFSALFARPAKAEEVENKDSNPVRLLESSDGTQVKKSDQNVAPAPGSDDPFFALMQNQDLVPLDSSWFFVQPKQPPESSLLPESLTIDAAKLFVAGWQQDKHWYTDKEITQILGILEKAFPQQAYMLAAAQEKRNDKQDYIAAVINDYKAARAAYETAQKPSVFIPVNLGGSHWTLLYLNYAVDGQLDAYYFNPLGGRKFPKAIADAVTQNYPTAKLHNISERVQTDGYNCGPWILWVAECILKNGLPNEKDKIQEKRGLQQYLIEEQDYLASLAKKRKTSAAAAQPTTASATQGTDVTKAKVETPVVSILDPNIATPVVPVPKPDVAQQPEKVPLVVPMAVQGSASPAPSAAKKPVFEHVYNELITTEETFCKSMTELAKLLEENKKTILETIKGDVENKFLVSAASVLMGAFKGKSSEPIDTSKLTAKNIFELLLDIYKDLSEPSLIENQDKNADFKERTAQLFLATDDEKYTQRISQLTLATIFYPQMQSIIDNARNKDKLAIKTEKDVHAASSHAIAPLQRVTKLVLLAKELLNHYEKSENADPKVCSALKGLLYRFKVITNCINQLKKLQETAKEDLSVSLITQTVEATVKINEALIEKNFDEKLNELNTALPEDVVDSVLNDRIPSDELVVSLVDVNKAMAQEFMSRSRVFAEPFVQQTDVEKASAAAVASSGADTESPVALSTTSSFTQEDGIAATSYVTDTTNLPAERPLFMAASLAASMHNGGPLDTAKMSTQQTVEQQNASSVPASTQPGKVEKAPGKQLANASFFSPAVIQQAEKGIEPEQPAAPEKKTGSTEEKASQGILQDIVSWWNKYTK